MLRQRGEALFSKGICPQLQPQPQRARTCARPAFFVFCLHLFTFRPYLTENKRLAGEAFTIWQNGLSSSCSMTYGWRQLPSPQCTQRGAASRQKRRSTTPRSTAAQRVKAAHRKAHPLAFTRNALWFKWLQRFLTRICKVKPSPVRCLLSADCDQKCPRWRQKNENLLCARNARVRATEQLRRCGQRLTENGLLFTESSQHWRESGGVSPHPLVLSTFSGQL